MTHRPWSGPCGLGIAVCLALALGGTARADNPPALTLLHTFGANDSAADEDGSAPTALVQGRDGAFYGTTEAGGAYGRGNVFRVSADGGQFSVLHVFGSVHSDGLLPECGLIEGQDGFLYGTTYLGGPTGGGTVFRVGEDGGGYGIVHSFAQNGGSGNSPTAALVQGGDGTLYGVTPNGGAGSNSGTVFKINPDGSGFATLHSFSAGAGDGAGPNAALVFGPGGFLYGTAEGGGAGSGGTVFKVAPDGTGFTVLHVFSARTNSRNSDGANPYNAALVLAGGSFYGSTLYGGAGALGVVFQISADGQAFQTLHSFTALEGGDLRFGLTLGSDGLLYGAGDLGRRGIGNLFRLNPDGTGYTALYVFGDGDNLGNVFGAHPSFGVVEGRDGALYGSALSGGTNNTGTVFRLGVSLRPPAPITHLLWDNPDGKAAFWNVASDGTPTVVGVFGPFADGSSLWHATALATGPDGVSHLLWNNADGHVALWNVTDGGSVTGTTGFGPYADGQSLWSATSLSVGPDGVIRLLWTNPDGHAAFWSVTGSGSVTGVTGYGPYTDVGPNNPWIAFGVSTGPDNVSHLLWANTNGKGAFWDLGADGSIASVTGYGPYTDGSGGSLWYANAVSTGPDDVSHLLWNNVDAKAAFWDVSSGDGSIAGVTGYGPFFDGSSPWHAAALCTGPDGVSRLLWNNTDGHAALWTLDGSGSPSAVTGYGPFTDGSASNLWSAVAVSAGP